MSFKSLPPKAVIVAVVLKDITGGGEMVEGSVMGIRERWKGVLDCSRTRASQIRQKVQMMSRCGAAAIGPTSMQCFGSCFRFLAARFSSCFCRSIAS